MRHAIFSTTDGTRMETSKNETPKLNGKVDISSWHPDNQNKLVRELLEALEGARAEVLVLLEEKKVLHAEIRRLYLESAK